MTGGILINNILIETSIDTDHFETNRHHVYSDLRPYICTFGSCLKPNQLYDSYTEWSEHERSFHRREWTCNLCSYTCQSSSLLDSHLRDNHAGIIPDDHLQVTVRVSERPIASAQQCPLCSKPPISDPSRFQQHLARHLQQLALFVLPLPVDEDSDQNYHDRGSNEPQHALMADDEAKDLSEVASAKDEDAPKEDHLNQHDILTMHENESASGDDYVAIEKPSIIRSSTAWDSAMGNENKLEIQQTGEVRSDSAEPNDASAKRNQEASAEYADSLTSVSNLGLALARQGKHEEAETMLWQALEGRQKMLGPEHIDTLASANNLSLNLGRQGKYEEAESMCQQALEGHKKVLGPENPDTLISASNLGWVLTRQGKYEDAGTLHQQILRSRQKVFGPEHPDTLTSASNLGLVLTKQGKYEEADRKYLGQNHPRHLLVLAILAWSLLARKSMKRQKLCTDKP